MRRITALLLVLVAGFAAVGVHGLAQTHPRNAALWGTLAVVSLVGAWLSLKTGSLKRAPARGQE